MKLQYVVAGLTALSGVRGSRRFDIERVREDWGCDSSHVDVELAVLYAGCNSEAVRELAMGTWTPLLDIIMSNVGSLKVAGGMSTVVDSTSGWTAGSNLYLWKTMFNQTKDLTEMSLAKASEATWELSHELGWTMSDNALDWRHFSMTGGVARAAVDKNFWDKSRGDARVMLVVTNAAPLVGDEDMNMADFELDSGKWQYEEINHDWYMNMSAMPTDHNFKTVLKNRSIKVVPIITPRQPYSDEAKHDWTVRLNRWDQDTDTITVLQGKDTLTTLQDEYFIQNLRLVSEAVQKVVCKSIFAESTSTTTPKPTTTTTTTSTTVSTTTSATLTTSATSTAATTTTEMSTTKKAPRTFPTEPTNKTIPTPPWNYEPYTWRTTVQDIFYTYIVPAAAIALAIGFVGLVCYGVYSIIRVATSHRRPLPDSSIIV